MSYRVFLVESLGAPRHHHAIFVETHENGKESGHVYQVTGEIQQGMRYEDKPSTRPEESATFQGKTQLGTVTTANYGRIGELCCAILPPKKQFSGPKRLYPDEPLRRCQEWTNEAIESLKEAKVIEQQA